VSVGYIEIIGNPHVMAVSKTSLKREQAVKVFGRAERKQQQRFRDDINDE